MSLWLASWVAWAVLVVSALMFRSRPYAIFRGIITALHNLIAVPLFAALPDVPGLSAVYLYFHAAVFVQALLLVRPRLMPVWYRVLVSWPAAFFAASTLLAFPWAIAHGLGWQWPLLWLPYLLGVVGLLQSLRTRESEVHILAGEAARAAGGPHDMARIGTLSAQPGGRPLRIVQLTDPHLGPFMSVARLRRIAERAAEREPDLVLLTGDFLTMESQADPSELAEALAPLKALKGRVFACRGNHDLEAPETVAEALERAGVRLLIDDSVVVDTDAGPVQVLGLDYAFRGRKERIRAACEAHPRRDAALRVVLLHDPGAFIHLAPGDADLVLSGHTHGGQVGLVSFGLPYTMLALFTRIPDHGLWGFGQNRLYVHRGTGHYGFPLRLGVPAEESLLCVHSTVE